MQLSSKFGRITFHQINLVFEEGEFNDVFAQKNNKSVAETLSHRRYQHLRRDFQEHFAESLEEPLGKFLFKLKQSGNLEYKRFLNKYGDLTYCRFGIVDRVIGAQSGVYAYSEDHEIRYIGRCRDSMQKRINHGYGKIAPKNCYLDGQATNCHLNALITPIKDRIQLWFSEVPADDIVSVERTLIAQYQPQWNIQRY